MASHGFLTSIAILALETSLRVLCICAACPNNVICSECYPNRATAFQPRGCKMTRRYVEVGGKKWKALANGQVSDGETLEQWLHRQSQLFGVELSAQ